MYNDDLFTGCIVALIIALVLVFLAGIGFATWILPVANHVHVAFQ